MKPRSKTLLKLRAMRVAKLALIVACIASFWAANLVLWIAFIKWAATR